MLYVLRLSTEIELLYAELLLLNWLQVQVKWLIISNS